MQGSKHVVASEPFVPLSARTLSRLQPTPCVPPGHLTTNTTFGLLSETEVTLIGALRMARSETRPPHFLVRGSASSVRVDFELPVMSDLTDLSRSEFRLRQRSGIRG